MEKLNMKTHDLTVENIEKLGQLFPDCIKESEDEDWNKVKKIDFDLLRSELWDQTIIEWLEERYRLDRPWKKRSILKANTPITKTLRPIKEDSVDRDNTQNLYIEWDNFEVLKILQESYLGKIKMVYIDPPYNTGNDFVYNDDFAEKSEEYKEKTEKDENWYIMVRNTETNGRFHSDWLSMMYERLKITRDLLADDWVIFMSIDDNEVDNLKKICNEIFWEWNCIWTIARKTKLTSNKWTFLAPSHEYILIYSKNILQAKWFNDSEAQESPEYLKLFKYEDSYSRYNIVWLYQPSLDPMRWCSNQRYYIQCPDGSFVIPKWNIFPDTISDGAHISPKSSNDMVWRRSYETYLKQKDNLVFLETKTSPLLNEHWEQAKWNVYTKIYLKDRLNSWMLPVSFIDKYPNSEASKELIKLDIPFSFSKPKNLIKYLLKIAWINDGYVLDFFSWSSTTAHACMQLNAEDWWDRKFIMVQLPEICEEKTEAYRQWYQNICEIWKERIRRSGKKIKEETNADIDYGFRVYRVDESCMKDVYYKPSETRQKDLWFFVSNIKEDRTSEDLLTQVILNLWLTLDLPIEEKKIWNNKVFYVAWNSLVACFDENVDSSIIEEIAKDQPLKMVLRDSSFRSDTDRINFENTMKELSKDTVIKVI